MRARTAILLGAGVVALGLAGVHAASAEGQRGWRGHGPGHGMGRNFDDRGQGWRHGRHADSGRDGDFRHRRGHSGAMMQARFVMLFDLLDVNADNAISREEAMRAPGQRFARLDADRNGFVSAEEAEQAAEAEPGRFRPRLVERLDVDGDGQVSRAEFEVGARTRFTRADANDDGTVTFREFAAAGRSMRRHVARTGGVDLPEVPPSVDAPGETETAPGDVEEPAASE